MTYTVSSGTLNLTQPTSCNHGNHQSYEAQMKLKFKSKPISASVLKLSENNQGVEGKVSTDKPVIATEVRH